MKTIAVRTSIEYEVFVDAGILDRAGAVIRDVTGGEIAAVVTDDVVANIYLDRLCKSLNKKGYQTPVFTFRSGEVSKSAYTYISLLEFLAENGVTRSDVIVALGGGVVGDIVGFAAATYMRGISYVQIPTTLLAAVDSSVGGKTGIDIKAGKNLVGVFHQPAAVICDSILLKMLPPRIFADGCAEIIKYGIIADSEMFGMLYSYPHLDIEEIVVRCITIKSGIVSADEFDNGKRRVLNFGHTVGHALEILSDFNISHGKAVAIGMAVETGAALKMGICEENCYNELINMLHRFGLPYKTHFSSEEISRVALSDKKRSGSSITLALPEEVGTCVLRKADMGDLQQIIELGLETVSK